LNSLGICRHLRAIQFMFMGPDPARARVWLAASGTQLNEVWWLQTTLRRHPQSRNLARKADLHGLLRIAYRVYTLVPRSPRPTFLILR
jgi:hypothetical protein